MESALKTARSPVRGMGNMEIAWLILVEPRSAFTALEDRPRFWFPLLCAVLATTLVSIWYYGTVDFAWLTDQIVSTNPKLQDMPEADRAQAVGFLSRNFLLGTSLVLAIAGIPAMRLLEATYYVTAGKATRLRQSFAQYFALASWAGFPLVIACIAMAAYLLLRGGHQVSMEQVQVLSLNELFFHVAPGNRWSTLLSSLTVLHPWSWWLSAVGVRAWTGRSMAFAATFVMLPVVATYGTWAAIVLF